MSDIYKKYYGIIMALLSNIQKPASIKKSLDSALSTPEVIRQLVRKPGILGLDTDIMKEYCSRRMCSIWNIKEYNPKNNHFRITGDTENFIFGTSPLYLKGLREELHSMDILKGSPRTTRIKFSIESAQGAPNNMNGNFFTFNFSSRENTKLNNITINNPTKADITMYLPNTLQTLTGFEYKVSENVLPDTSTLVVYFGDDITTSEEDLKIRKTGFSEYRYCFDSENNEKQNKHDLNLLCKQIKLLRKGFSYKYKPGTIYLRCWLYNWKAYDKEMYEWVGFFREKFALKGITGIEFKGNPKHYSFIDFVI